MAEERLRREDVAVGAGGDAEEAKLQEELRSVEQASAARIAEMEQVRH